MNPSAQGGEMKQTLVDSWSSHQAHPELDAVDPGAQADMALQISSQLREIIFVKLVLP